MKQCDYKGCKCQGDNVMDVSLQLPDYRYYCKKHYDEVNKLSHKKWLSDQVFGCISIVKSKMCAVDQAIGDLKNAFADYEDYEDE
jgi:hypothetical protein